MVQDNSVAYYNDTDVLVEAIFLVGFLPFIDVDWREKVKNLAFCNYALMNG